VRRWRLAVVHDVPRQQLRRDVHRVQRRDAVSTAVLALLDGP